MWRAHVAGRGVRAGAGLRVRAADLLRVAARHVALHAGRGRPLRPRHLVLGKLRQGRVRAHTIAPHHDTSLNYFISITLGTSQPVTHLELGLIFKREK